MTFIPLPGGIKVSMEFQLNNEPVVNVYHVAYANPIVSANLAFLTDLFRDWWTNEMRQNFTTTIALERVVALDVSEEDGLVDVLDLTTPVAGTIASTAAPNNVAIVASKLTGFSGRSFRGRTYFGGIQQTEVVDNFISNTLAAAILVDLASLSTQLQTNDYDLIVASYRANNEWRTTAVGTGITAFAMDTRVDTMRKRLPDAPT